MVVLPDDLTSRVVVLGDLDFPDDALSAVGPALIQGIEGELIKVEHLSDVRPVLEAFDPATLDQVGEADNHRGILLNDHIPKVHDGVALGSLRRNVHVLASEALFANNHSTVHKYVLLYRTYFPSLGVKLVPHITWLFWQPVLNTEKI